MIRVVLDTNIVMSALLNPRGALAQVFLMIILEPDTQVCVSGDIFAEYEDVLRRPRFSRSDGDIQAALRTIREKALWVKPLEKIHASPDPDDNIFLECAQASAAHYLVTGNVKHFPSEWGDTQIVTARQFLDAIR
jgi:uncharacterized protein